MKKGLAFLFKRQAELKSSMETLLTSAETEERVLTKEEMDIFSKNKDELEEIKTQIVAIEGAGSLSADAGKTNLVAASDPLTNPEQEGKSGLNAMSAPKDFSSLEDFMQSVIYKQNDPRLAKQYQEYKSDQAMGDGPSGGFAIPRQFQTTIREVKRGDYIVRPRAEVIPAGSPPDAEIVIPALDQETTAGGAVQTFGGVAVAKIAEGGLKPSQQFNLRQISLQPHELAGYIPMTDKLLRNWSAAATYAARLLKSAINNYEDLQFFLGNGVGGPLGVIPALSTIKIARTTTMTVLFADIKKMYAAFKGLESNAVWVISYATVEKFLNMVGDGGGATNIIAVDKATGQMSIYGIPVLKSDHVPTLGTKGDVGLYDFGEYLIKDGSGPIVESGYAQGQWERNTRSIKVTWNVDGKPWISKPYKDESGFLTSSAVVLDIP